MAKKTVLTTAKKKTPVDSQRQVAVRLFALGVIILLGGMFAWYQYVHKSAYNVFWDTIDNNLNIFGVTRTIEQDANGAEFNQKLQISLGAENVARGATVITQPTQEGTTTVITETLGTPTNNYTRYIDITTQTADGSPVKQPDISSVKNVWSRESLTQGDTQNQNVNQSAFAEGLFSSVPFAYLSQPQRQKVVQFMKDNEVYSADYRNAKTVNRAGKQAYEYNVVVNLKGYIETLKMIDEMMGLQQLTGVNPAAYDGAEPAQLTIVSGIDGRQLLEVSYTGTTRKETYSAYGARIHVDLPETNLPRTQLEEKIQSIFTPQTST